MPIKKKKPDFSFEKQAHVFPIMLTMMKQGGDFGAIAEKYYLVEEEQHHTSRLLLFQVPYIGRFGVESSPHAGKVEMFSCEVAGFSICGACLLSFVRLRHLLRNRMIFAIPFSMSPERPGLDLSSVEALHQGREAPPNKLADGRERRFILGEENAAVAVDVYPTHPALVRIFTRTGEEAVSLGRVRSIAPDGNGGLRIHNTNTECLIGSDGMITFIRTLPEPEIILFQESAVGQKKGKYTQATLEASHTKEGDRVERYGKVEASPKPVNKRRNSPLQFVLVVDDPEKEGGKDRLEVYATNKAKQQVQRSKLVKDDRIQAVLYRHTWTTETIGGDKMVHTRYNLATLLAIERKDEIADAKRMTMRQNANQE